VAMVSEVRKAMVLAAGEGIRLRPLTLETPKLLLPLGEAPLICHILAWLKSYGICEVAINLHHLGDKIKEFLGDGTLYGLKIVYSPEEALLGTAGGVKRMESFFDGPFVVVYGDMLIDFDLSAMIRFHKNHKAMATLALFETSKPWEVGIVQVNGDGRVVSLVEKPEKGNELGNLANGGIYVLEKEVFEHIPEHGFCDFGYEVFPRLIKTGLPIYGYVLGPQDYLIDIGTPEKYNLANSNLKSGRVRLSYG